MKLHWEILQIKKQFREWYHVNHKPFFGGKKMYRENINENDEIRYLKKMLRESNNKRINIRLHTLILHYRGYTNVHIASILGLCEHTVGKYIRAYEFEGIDGLKMGKSTGTPRFLSKEQEQILYEVIITKTPDEVGFGYRKNWTADVVRKWVEDTFEVRYSTRGMLEVLHRLNLSYTRPTYTLAKADEIKQETFKQDFERLKKLN